MMRTRQSCGQMMLNNFDKIFVINLPSRADRRKEMERQLNRVGLGLDHPSVCLVPAIRPKRKLEFPTAGTRGCFLSHVNVLERAISMCLSRFLVLEDDVDFVADFSQKLTRVDRYLKQVDWDMFYGYTPKKVPKPDLVGASGMVMVAPNTGIECLHFFAASGRCAVKAMPYLKSILHRPAGDPRGGAMHVDGAYSWFRRDHPELLTLAADPKLAVQRPSRSDIHELRWFDRNRVTRPVVHWARQFKRAMV